jgi:hypothetical protein
MVPRPIVGQLLATGLDSSVRWLVNLGWRGSMTIGRAMHGKSRALGRNRLGTKAIRKQACRVRGRVGLILQTSHGTMPDNGTSAHMTVVRVESLKAACSSFGWTRR